MIEKWRPKHDVATKLRRVDFKKHEFVRTLDFGRGNDIENTKLWQRCFDVGQRRDQKLTKTQGSDNVKFLQGHLIVYL